MCGFKSHFGVISVVGGGAVLDILDGNWEGLRTKRSSSKKKTFLTKIVGKKVKKKKKKVSHCQTASYPVQWNEKK